MRKAAGLALGHRAIAPRNRKAVPLSGPWPKESRPRQVEHSPDVSYQATIGGGTPPRLIVQDKVTPFGDNHAPAAVMGWPSPYGCLIGSAACPKASSRLVQSAR